MRIFINEIYKIWNIRILLIVALLCTLFYWLFMSFNVDYFPNGHPATEEVEYSIELLQRYGPTLEEEEYSEFIGETREELISEIEMHIENNPVFADAGIYSHDDYEKMREKQASTEAEREVIWKLFGEECDFAGFRLQTLDDIESRYHHYPQNTLKNLFSEATREKEIARLTTIEQTEEYRNIMDWQVYHNTVEYNFYLAILSALAVLVLVSPLIVTDRARNVHLLQYSSKLGRRILSKQFISVILSAFLHTTVLILIFGAIYSTNGTWVFWNSGMTSFLNDTFWIDLTYGQYILIYIVLLYTLCLGTAAMAFILSRFSRNLITLILKIIPVFAMLTVLCGYVFKYTFSPANLLYGATGIIGVEPYVCGFVFIAGLAASLYFVRREKKVDVI